jgi:CheY-like chemotaxis protein
MPIRILIADDNPSVRTALRRLLESTGGWEIVDVENGQQAVAKAQELRPNVVILDLVMPVMDGLTAARELSKLQPEIPLLMHTLHWSPQVELEAQKVGVRKVVPKADSKGLISAIQQALAAEPPKAVSALPEAIPAVLPPPNITALPPITDSDPAKAAPTDKPEAPKVAGPDDLPESSPPT